MNFHILTLFPEMIEQGLHTSILGRAREASLIAIDAVNIRDYTKDKHNKVDDYPYGGGAGMLMQAQPVYDAYQAVKNKLSGKQPRVIYLTPQGKTFSQEMAEEFAREEELVFLCGHYEGIDERVLEEIVTDEVSIGDYVLTGGELAAMVMIDAIARLVPGVLHNGESAHTESFHNHLLEYPQYSRPEVWQGKNVPQVLLCGDHKKIDKWRLEKSVERTKAKRPDLYEKYAEGERAIAYLMQKKLIHMDMIEAIRLGCAKLLYFAKDGLALLEKRSGVCMITAQDTESGIAIFKQVQKECRNNLQDFVFHGEALLEDEKVCSELGLRKDCVCYQAVYTRGVPLLLPKNLKFELLTEKDVPTVLAHYALIPDEKFVRERIAAGVMLGAYEKDTLVGFIGEHEEGSSGMLEVFPEYRRKGIGTALEAASINRMLSVGRTPYGQIIEGNEASLQLQKRMGMRVSKERLGWYTVV